jgi:hypothetical protein
MGTPAAVAKMAATRAFFDTAGADLNDFIYYSIQKFG